MLKISIHMLRLQRYSKLSILPDILALSLPHAFLFPESTEIFPSVEAGKQGLVAKYALSMSAKVPYWLNKI